jgi:hypothetical protein
LSASIAVGRWDQISTGPVISPEVLTPVVGTLAVAILVNLVILLRQPVT